ncbi:MAG: sensor histidine kinase [Candidatus Binatia bacterium]
MRTKIRLDPFQRFLAAMLLCSGLAIAVLGGAVDRLLTRNLFDREAQVTTEAVRAMTNLDLTPEQFRFAASNNKVWAFVHLTQHLTSIPEILHVKVYDEHGTAVWSDDAQWMREDEHSNPQLAAALKGQPGVEVATPKALRAGGGEGSDGRRMLQVYVPTASSDGKVYAVFEIHKNPVTFFRNLDTARRMLWLISFGVGAVLFVLLAHIFLRARRTEMGLHTRNREVEAQLIQAEKLSVVGEMAAAIAHEINNPLGIMMGKAQELQAMADERSCPQLCRQDFDVMGREIGRIAEVVRGLLLFARKSETTLAATDVNQVLRETVRFVGPSFARVNVTIVPEHYDALPLVRADANQLKQVFLNLLQNAKDAMPEGGTIRLRTWPNNGCIHVEVIDSGTGIRPETIGRVFDPFFSTKKSGDGSGLGLSVSYGIIKAHGGSIEVSSKVGHGSVFRVVLPTLA